MSGAQNTEMNALSSSHPIQNIPLTSRPSNTSQEDNSSQPGYSASKDDSMLDMTVEDGKEATESKDQSLHPEDEKNAVVKDLEKGSPAGEQPKTETPRDPNLVCANFSTSAQR